MYVIASIVMFSCTDDTAETNQSKNNTVKVVVDDPGDPILIPPPKP